MVRGSLQPLYKQIDDLLPDAEVRSSGYLTPAGKFVHVLDLGLGGSAIGEKQRHDLCGQSRRRWEPHRNYAFAIARARHGACPPCSRGFPQALAEARPTESLSATRERYGLREHVVTDTALEQVRHARNTERIRSGKNTDRI